MCVCFLEGHYCEFCLSIFHAQDESGCLQVSVPAVVVLQGHKPTEVQLLHILWHTQTCFNTLYIAQKKNKIKCAQSGTYMSILGIIEEIQRIPTQAGPQSPGRLSHRHKQTCKIKGYTAEATTLLFFHICLMDVSPFLSLPHFLSQEMDRGWATAAVSLWPWISAMPCTWARLTLHVYIALKWA